MEKAILKVELTCNTPDKKLVENLRACKARNLPLVGLTTVPNERLLLICGSGPSLFKYHNLVSTLWPDHDVMALNGAYRALQSVGVIPKYYAQLDARPVNVNFVSTPDENTTFLLASQCDPLMFEALRGQDIQIFHLNTPTTNAVFKGADIYFGGGSTIGTTAIGVAAALGYRSIAILGYDSCFWEGKSHVLPQEQNAAVATIPVWIDDKEYLTTPAMAKQVEEFRPWIKGLTAVFPDIDVRLFGEGLLYDYIVHGQRKEVTRESEAEKYTEMYKDPSYAMPKHRADKIAEILCERPRGTLLDVGTGRGETLDIARLLGYDARGTETVDYLVKARENVDRAVLPELPYPDKSFDIVTCFEVIEHLLPADVMPALRELRRVAKDRIIISAATCSDIRGGVELHPSYRREWEWEETFKAAWGWEAEAKKLGNLSINDVSPVYEYRLRSESK
jgi:hypothetical protein